MLSAAELRHPETVRAAVPSVLVDYGWPDLFVPVREQRLRTFLLAGLAVLMPISRVFEVVGKTVNCAVADAILPLGALLLVWRTGQGRVRAPMAALCCLNLATVFLSSLLNLELALSNRGPGGLTIEFVKVAFLWLYFYIVVNSVDSRRDFLVLLAAWMVGSAITAGFGIYGSLSYQLTGVLNPFARMFRAQGTFEDSNLYAIHLSLSFLLALLYRRLSPRPARWIFPVILVQLAGVFFSASRGATLALLLCLGILCVSCASWRTRLAAAGAVLGLALLVAAIPNKQALLESNPLTARLGTTTVDLDNPEAAQRKALWDEAIREFLLSPLFGVGRGDYGLLQPGEPTPTREAHNTYLELLCDSGLIGFTIFALVFSRYPLRLIRDWMRLNGRSPRTGTGILLTGMIMIGLDAITIDLETYRGLWMLMAITEGYTRLYTPGRAFEA